MTRRPSVVLFDLGGVLVEVAGAARTIAWAGMASHQALFGQLLTSEAFRQFEMGRRSPESFAQAMCAELRLPVGPATFLADFAGWPNRVLPGAPELIAAIPDDVVVACLSNNNAVHWPRLSGELGLGRLFAQQFLSHHLGMIKPDPAIYHHVIRALAVPPGAILFLDDNPANVRAALAHGIDARRVLGVADARLALRSVGL
jgi:putative hydrolase of the HAD superfamily